MTKVKDEIKILSPQIPNELKSLDIGNSHIEDEDFSIWPLSLIAM
ncbi:hypothetical protein ACR77J_03730 [Tissierella praeacuta]